MVGYIRTLNKLLMLPVPLFCLRFLSPVVHNFSNHTLSNSGRYLLSLGLKFRPTPRVLSLNVLNKQLDDFVRSVRLKYFFRDSMHSHQFHKLSIKSDWNPPKCPPWIEIPLAAIRFELCSLSHCHRRNFVSSNLSRSELSSLASLRSLNDVKILPADKNLGPTLVSTLWYKKEVSRLLSDVSFYEEVCAVPFDAMKSKLISILDRYGKSIGEKLKRYVLQFSDNCTPARFKILPKVHKTPLVGRPIVASTSYLTTPASRLVDHFLAPHLPSLPSYLKDSTNFIRDIGNLSLSPGSYLVTADVTSLYTNIPITDCITAIDLFCRSVGCEYTALVTELSRFVLTNNYFEAEGVLFHQKWGLAMGTPFAVSAAVIYMARLEDPLLSVGGLFFYRRFIDDIFFIWSGSLCDLHSFLDRLNNLAPTIKLTWNVSQQEAIFLDMVVYVDRTSPTKLSTKPYQKPLNRYLYIPFNSYHPSHAKRSFIKAELIRYVRLSSCLSAFLEIRKKFFNRLQNRGYPRRFLLEVFSEVHYSSRHKLLSRSKDKSKDVSHLVFFKTYRNPLFHDLHLKNLFQSHLDNDLDVIICYKATASLAKLLVSNF